MAKMPASAFSFFLTLAKNKIKMKVGQKQKQNRGGHTMAKKTTKDLLELLRKSGLPFKVVKIKIDPEIEREVNKYVQSIEEAHRRAAKSKLRFKAAVLVG